MVTGWGTRQQAWLLEKSLKDSILSQRQTDTDGPGLSF